jgi:hypothetical protein
MLVAKDMHRTSKLPPDPVMNYVAYLLVAEGMQRASRHHQSLLCSKRRQKTKPARPYVPFFLMLEAEDLHRASKLPPDPVIYYVAYLLVAEGVHGASRHFQKR